ncbi:DNA polymerase-3 subunit gamma/tau [Maledivibacter halophilus]|uniref:DNA-directed DNA polymerase n=2 Tax=Maledivibacter halophilus TaxID=36842 RepID=A0A1T5MUB3_9FIRM|nr:DNA polymerase-3 subunit gamma/tau [Maledivibacter halophilus]
MKLMGYTALYRKWRPIVFEEVVGQSHITMTIKNQIKNDSIAHAYLFCGTRGTGKTSTAKIFARAINCLSPKGSNPCNECEVCRGILNESIMDVVEIDAASNNGVDNIRELRENVKYPPSKAKFKVYIIDEVHMLSQGAFNALLKTLEEPPSYVIFILATTEPQKIPSTILSRCQRFDFKRLASEDLFKRLKYICTKMDIEIEDEVIRLIVRNSDGAARDALSILDQCISFSQDKLTYEKAIETLGLVTDEFLFKLTDAIYDEDPKKAMELIDDLINSGKDISQFLRSLINHFRNLMMIKMTDSLEEVIDMSRENIERLKNQGEKFQLNTIIRIINILSESESNIKWSSQPRILLELAVVKLIRPNMDNSIEGLLDRIRKLENKINSLDFKDRKEDYTIKAPKIVSLKQNTYKNTDTVSQEKISRHDKDKNIKENNSLPEDSHVDFKKIKEKWNIILKEIRQSKISVHAVLMEGNLVRSEGNKLIISFREGFWFHKDATSKKSNSEFIEKVISQITGEKVKLICVMEDEIEHNTNEEEKKEEDFSEKKEEIEQVKEYFSDFQDKLEIIE